MKPLTFRIYVDPKQKYYRSKRHFQVFLFPEHKAMYRFADAIHDEIGSGHLPHNYGGLTIGFSRVGRRDKGLKGYILLGGNHCHMVGVISHEMVHAAHYTVIPLQSNKRTHGKAVLFPDEKLAWLQGEFVRQFWDKWWKLKEAGRIRAVKPRRRKAA